jgi:hypothetical protein
MADTGQAQNKLGELFVDIGVGGLGKTLKALNSVSATFLMTKNAAVQAIKPIVDMGKQAASGAVGIGQMANSLATTAVNAQKLKWLFKQYNVEGAEGGIAGLQQVLNKAHTGYGGIDAMMAMSMGELGLNWSDYDGSFESVTKLIKDIQTAFKERKVRKEDQIKHLQNMGLDTRLAYLFDRSDFDINKMNAYSDNDAQALIDFQESLQNLSIQKEILKSKTVSNVAQKGGTNIIDNIAGGIEAITTDDVKKKKKYAAHLTVGEAWKQLKQETKELFGGNKLEPIPAADAKALNPDVSENATLPLDSIPATENNIIVNNYVRNANGQFEFEEIDVDVNGKKVDTSAITVHNQSGL